MEPPPAKAQEENPTALKRPHPDTDGPITKRQNTGHESETAAATTNVPAQAILVPAAAPPRATRKGWTARHWYATHYADLADKAWRDFPMAEFCQQHGKTEKEVGEVWTGVIDQPLLAKAGRAAGEPRGGVGQSRMKAWEEETKRTIRQNDAEVAEEVTGQSKHLLCRDCKEKPATKPATIEEARADVKAALREFNRLSDILEALQAQENEQRGLVGEARKSAYDFLEKKTEDAATQTADDMD